MFRLIVKLAWNNAFLRLSRTLLVIIMIAVSMSMMLSIQGIYDGMTVNMIDKTKRSDCGELSIYNPKYRLEKLITNDIAHANEIKSALQQRADISAVVTRFSVEGLAATARKSAFANIIGINLEDEQHFGQFDRFLKEGEMKLSRRGTLIGSELAKTLKVHVGSKVIFSTQDSQGEINGVALKVKGIVQTSNITLDASALYIDRLLLNGFLGIDSHSATQIAIRSENPKLQEILQKEYPDLEVKRLLELYPMLQQMKDMMMIFNSITFFIVMLVVFIGILGVMYVSILDRIREFGIMRAVGMSYRYIRLQIFLEALFVGVVGYVIGALLGILSLLYLNQVGLNLSDFSEGLASFGMDTVIYAHIELSYFSNTFFAIITASLLSVILPLQKIKRLHPIEVIKAET